MIASKYNQVTQIDSTTFALYNPLSGAFDIAGREEAERFRAGTPESEEEQEYWLGRGYFFTSPSEEKVYLARRYDDFVQESCCSPVQFMLVLSYACNMNCSYCYQRGIANASARMSIDMLDAFITAADTYRSHEKREVIVSLFGGEPLLQGEHQRELISHLITRLNELGIGLSVVTNGYRLKEYIGQLSQADIREIHITLDGEQEDHDRRRPARDGSGTFLRIFGGLTAAVDREFPVNLRVVVDRKNIQALPGLAERLDALGYLDLPKERFKVALGRNYELIDQQVHPEDLFTLDELFEAYVGLMSRYPVLENFYVPSFFGITQLATTGEMYVPSFDTCPAAKSEFVFDASGNIYGCTASCGREGYSLGTFYPDLRWNTEELQQWRNRSILTIPECRECSLGVVCGGGCGVIARDRQGKVLAPQCKPVKNIMDLGIRFYKDVWIGHS